MFLNRCARAWQEELSLLQQGGRGRILWIEGGAGIGKSTLVRNFFRMASLNVPVSAFSLLLLSDY